MSVKIPESLLFKLKESFPNVDLLIDESQSYKFVRNGNFDELLFRRYLLDKKRASIYRRVSDKGRSIASDLLSDGEKSIIESVKEFSQYIWEDISELLDIESRISKIIGEYSVEKNRNNIQGLKNSIHDSISTGKQELDDGVTLSSTQLDSEKDGAIRKFSYDKSNVDSVRSFLSPQIDKFKEENRRSVEEMKRVIGDNLRGIGDEKLSKLDESKGFTLNDLELTEEERRQGSEQMKDVFKTAIRNQRRLRRETADGLIPKITDFKNTEEAIRHIKSSKEISDEDKNRLEKLMTSDYLDYEDIKLASKNKVLVDRTWIHNIEYSIFGDAKKKRELLDNAYKSDIGRFCNGGWGSVAAHLISFGFCTGYTATAAIIEATLGEGTRLTALGNLLIMTVLLCSIPISAISGNAFVVFGVTKIVEYTISEVMQTSWDEEGKKFTGN